MICTEFWKGQGLGNQLACYITTRCIALDNGYEWGIMGKEKFKGNFIDLDFGKEIIGGFTPIEGQEPSILPDGIIHYYKEKETINQRGTNVSGYDDFLKDIPDHTKLDGLMQGVEYFSHRRSEIQDWLKVAHLEIPNDLCIINFRGGEYKYVKDFFLSHSYWENAIAIMTKENPDIRFEVHTDDPECAKYFFPNYPIVSNIELNWRTLRYCKHAILSNSSFAILPIWLNDNVNVIAPKYFGRFNTEEGWCLEQNKVQGWRYLDKHGVCSTL